MANSICPEWTIGIPTFNRYEMLQQAVRSAIDQKLKPGVILVSDNCSTDNTPQISCPDSSIKFSYYRQEVPVSALENFKSLLDRCETEYFSWLQDDDILYPSFSDLAIAPLEINPNAVAAVSYAFHSEDLLRIRFLHPRVWGPPAFEMDFKHGKPFHVPQYALLPWLTDFMPGFSPVAIYRTHALRAALEAMPSVSGYSNMLAEHYIMGKLNSIGDIIYIPAVLGVLRAHGHQETRKYSTFSAAEVAEANLDLYDFLEVCLSANSSCAEEFFEQNINVFTPPEVSHFYATLSSRQHAFSQLVANWILKHYRSVNQLTFTNETNCAAQPKDSSALTLRSVAREILPPISLRLLRAAKTMLNANADTSQR